MSQDPTRPFDDESGSSDEPLILDGEMFSNRGMEGETNRLLFRFGERTAALLAEDVEEIFSLDNITPVPRSPRSVLGLTNLRGIISPVIDLISILRDPPPPWRSKKLFCILLRHKEDTFVLAANEIIRIVPWPQEPPQVWDEALQLHLVQWRDHSVLMLDKEDLHHRIAADCREAFNRKLFVAEA